MNQNKATTACDASDEMNIGIIMIASTQQTVMANQAMILRKKSGETSCCIILSGFIVSWIRPTGGIKYGSILGSDLAVPTGKALAFEMGIIWISNLSLTGLPSFLMVSQNESSFSNSISRPSGKYLGFCS